MYILGDIIILISRRMPALINSADLMIMLSFLKKSNMEMLEKKS